MTKLYLTPKQKRLLLELAAENGTTFYNLEHMPREEAAKKIDYWLEQSRKRRLV